MRVRNHNHTWPRLFLCRLCAVGIRSIMYEMSPSGGHITDVYVVKFWA